ALEDRLLRFDQLDAAPIAWAAELGAHVAHLLGIVVEAHRPGDTVRVGKAQRRPHPGVAGEQRVAELLAAQADGLAVVAQKVVDGQDGEGPDTLTRTGVHVALAAAL